ncbi:hypothetical protein GGI1_20416 [Acidithiobacillus sp. GGI-221]|nr:hypothetical protein GGI1_20416 [Acidithiobacillus sp. GGI-221]
MVKVLPEPVTPNQGLEIFTSGEAVHQQTDSLRLVALRRETALQDKALVHALLRSADTTNHTRWQPSAKRGTLRLP